MIKLRDYQQSGVDETRNFFNEGGKHAILEAPTGAGKTVIFSYIAKNASKQNSKVLILTDRTELLMQTDGALNNFGIKPYLIRAGCKYIKFESEVFIAMCQTLRNRIKKDIWIKWLKNHIDLIIIDECHKQEFNFIFQSGLLDDKFVLGFTATPKRTGKMRQLALDYEKIIPTVDVKGLIEMGYLVADDYYGVSGVDLNNIKYDKMKGDYSESDMFSRFNAPKLYAGVVKNWMEVAADTHTLVFCVNIEHAIHTCEEFHKNGIDARFIVSKMGKPKEPDEYAEDGDWVRYEERMRLYNLYLDSYGRWSGTRSQVIKSFKNMEFPVLINAGILTAGFDCPEIETVVVNRATTSKTLWLQMVGRGSRLSPLKESFTILDFGDNANRLGHYSAPQLWSLWHEVGESGDGVAPIKECGIKADGSVMKQDSNGRKGCGRYILASYMICPFCGYKYPKTIAEEIDLKAVMYDNVAKGVVGVKKINEMNVDELYDYYKKKRHKPAWLWRQLYFRGGKELIENFGLSKNWTNGTINRAVTYVSAL